MQLPTLTMGSLTVVRSFNFAEQNEISSRGHAQLTFAVPVGCRAARVCARVGGGRAQRPVATLVREEHVLLHLLAAPLPLP